jgi:ATP-dependent Clp protease ATP-binding subunit ClpA
VADPLSDAHSPLHPSPPRPSMLSQTLLRNTPTALKFLPQALRPLVRTYATPQGNNPQNFTFSLGGQEPQSGESLKKYSIDLTELARKSKLDPVIGRDEEIRRTIQILSRRTKNNVCYVGPAGVGKTAVMVGSPLPGRRRGGW